MKDLTENPVAKHVIQMAIPIAAGMLFQTLYFLIDLYFVARLGDAALAGAGAAGNVSFLVLALTQVLSVGAVTLISQAVGRKDRDDANLVFNQSLALSATCGCMTLVAGYAFAAPFMRTLGSNPATVLAGVAYLRWFLPSLALQFGLAALGSALRGTGIVKPTMIVQVLTVALNAVLAPVLIAGWGTGLPMGVAGAGLASSVSVGLGLLVLGRAFHRLEHYVGFDRALWRPRAGIWARMLGVGLPAGGEFALMFLFMGVIYWIIRPFGQDAQAGFGVGMRLMQCLFLPAMAVAFATAPIVGQNFGAGKFARVREAFAFAAFAGAAIMVVLTLVCQWGAFALIDAFASDAGARAVGAEYLRICSWNFVATGLVFTCSGVFQGLGNTLPSVWSSGTRLLSFVVPALWLSSRPGFELRELWFVSVASVSLQALVSLALVRRELRRKLGASVSRSMAAAGTTVDS
jgi:putative MATE family efflux protein